MDTFVYRLNDSLYINLTNRCSNDCAFCIRSGAPGGGGDGRVGGADLWLSREPEADEVIAALNAMDFKKAREAVFCGYGEPSYRVNVIAAVGKYARKHKIPVRLNTNGQGNLINGRDITAELKGAVDTVSISLNYAAAEGYRACKSVYGDEGYFGMLEFARLCVKRKIKTVMSVVDVIPPAEIEKCRQIASDIGAVFRIRKFI